MNVRRVVTGVRNGKAVFLSDEEIQGYNFKSVPGFAQTALWSTEAAPKVGGKIAPDATETIVPRVGGTRLMVVTFPPDSVMMSPQFSPEAAGAEYGEVFRDFAACFEPDAPGMHTTPTLDYGVLLRGNISLEVDDGQIAQLNPGDVVIQGGARHGWRNPNSTPATLLFVLMGAQKV
jgi:hypothetical protein